MYVLAYFFLFSASNVHCQGSRCCRGCGPQEWFYGCADIAIEPSSTGNSPDSYNFGHQNTPSGQINNLFISKTTKQTPVHIDNIPDSFLPLNVGLQNGDHNLPQNIVTVPVGSKTSECRAKPGLRYYDDMCRKMCAVGNCPVNWCIDACQNLKR